MSNTFSLTPPFPDTRAEFSKEIHLGRVFQREHDNALPDDLFWRYSVKRHDAHPHRFDLNHKTIGKMIEKVPHDHGHDHHDQWTTGLGSAAVAAPGACPSAVPEPAAWLTFGMGLVAVAWWARTRS